MRFEERELPLWSVPLTISDLHVGVTYFILSFIDGEMHVPELRPVVFAGADLNDEGEGRLYFQDFMSYQRGTRYAVGTVDFEGTFDMCLSGDLGFVYEYERALDQLLACSLRRRGRTTPPAAR